MSAASSINNKMLTLARRIAISLPVCIFINDATFSIHKVQGTSMEPTLQDGDILLIRKADFFFFSTYHRNNDLHSVDTLRRFMNDVNDEEEKESIKDDVDRDRISRMDRSVGKYPGFLISWPVNPLPGHVVLFKCPMEFPYQRLHVKRVVGLGGQMVRPTDRFRHIESVPSYSVWVEGDNTDESVDSRQYGTVSKKLLVGQAERIIWPPSRWGSVERIRPNLGRAWW